MKKHLLSIAAFLFVAITVPGAEKDDPSKSMYIPLCLEVRHVEPSQKNAIYVQGGPSNLTVAGEPNETLMTFGYMRRIKSDLSLGITFIGTNKRYLGTTFGFGYHF